MSDKPYFSLAIKEDSKKTLDKITATHKLTQSEVIEALLDMTEACPSQSFEQIFQEKYEKKMEARKLKHEKKATVKKLLAKMSPEDLEKLLSGG